VSNITRIVLLGNRGCGKTSIAKLLCHHYNNKINNNMANREQYIHIDID
jgi:shikimate kinase